MAAVLLCSTLVVTAAETEGQNLLPILDEIQIEPIFEGGSTVTIDESEFYPIYLPRLLQSTYASDGGTLPGERSETVSEVKNLLSEEDTLEFVAHSQLRPEVIDLFDSHLETLVGTLYDFCGLEKDVQLDELTVYLLRQMLQLPDEMKQDIYNVYKNRMIDAGIDGTLLRSGESLGLYYVAQTDSDWRDYPFPNEADASEADDTMYDRSCGVMSMTMVASTYLHRELDPTELADYVIENGYRITASGVDDTFMQVAASLYGLPELDIYYQEPEEGQETIDWDYVINCIQENDALAIVHMYRGGGNFTPAQHYMVLAGYEEIDGIGYFLVEDPYQSRRYSAWGTEQMGDPGLGEEGIIYSTPELIAETCSAVTLFEQDKNEWNFTCQSSSSSLLPAA